MKTTVTSKLLLNKIHCLMIMSFMLIFIFTPFQNSNGQSRIEQLEAKLQNAQEAEKGDICNQLSQMYLNVNADKSFEYASKALANAKLSGNVNTETTAHINMGLASYKLGNYQSAASSFTISQSIHEKHNSPPGVAYNHIQIGLCYKGLGKSDVALDHFNKAQGIYKSLNDHSGMSNALISTGDLYTGKKQYEKASGYYVQSLPHYEAAGDKMG